MMGLSSSSSPPPLTLSSGNREHRLRSFTTPRARRPWRLAPSAACALALAASSADALAQEQVQQLDRLQRQMRERDLEQRATLKLGQEISERSIIDAGLIARLGLFVIDDENSESHTLRQYEANLFVRADFDGAHRFFGRLRFQYDDWNSGDSFDGDGDDFNDPVVDRDFYEFDYRGLLRSKGQDTPDFNFTIRGGRQYVAWNSGLTLSAPLDAALAKVQLGDFTITGLGGRTSTRDVVDFDGSRPNFDERTARWFFGAQVDWDLGNHKPFAYILVQEDDNDPDQANVGGFFPTRFDYNSRYLGVGSTGVLSPRWQYAIEGVYEFGESLSSPIDAGGGTVPQTEEDISAFAGIASLTYLFLDDNDTRLDFDLIAGSGDDDRLDSSSTFGGNAPGTDDNAFNSLGFVNTGLALVPNVTNLVVLRGGASTSLLMNRTTRQGDLRIGVDGFVFHKIDDDAPISVPTTNDGYVGFEVDFFIDWRIYSDLFATIRYGAFFPGEAIPDGQDDRRDFLYVGVTYAF